MLKSITHDDVLELRLDRPPVNALDPGLVGALHAALAAAPKQGARALVLSGSPGMFSAGLDVPALLQLDRDGIRGFWQDFFGLLEALAVAPLPVASAITGHCPAGGTVLTLFCDTRIMARGDFRIGLNEVQVGLPVPAPIVGAFRRLLGARVADPLLIRGALVDPEAALEAGMVDRLVAADEVVDTALGWCRDLLALPPGAMLRTRELARADLAELFRADRLPVDEFTRTWFADETQTAMRALVERLGRK